VGQKKKFNDQPFAYHAEIELEITTLTNLGSGLGRVTLPSTPVAQLPSGRENGTGPSGPAGNAAAKAGAEAGTEAGSGGEARRGGWVVLVPFTLPGERVRARVFRNHKNFSEADLVEVLTPSPDRVAPRCDLFGR
jgi:23S rRNA (uracil1939-C5)-methyltransferase/tRNA (uracil-5-)-methyltransferase